MVVWCQLRGWPKDIQRTIFQPVGFAAFVVSAISLSVAGQIATETVKLYLLGLPLALGGTWIGLKLYGRFDDAFSADRACCCCWRPHFPVVPVSIFPDGRLSRFEAVEMMANPSLHADAPRASLQPRTAAGYLRSLDLRMNIAKVTRRALAASLLAGCCLMLGACAGTSQSSKGIMNKQDESQILAALQASVEAWNRGDLKGHLAIYDLSVTVMTKNGPRPTIEAIEASFRQTYFVDGKPKQSLRMESVAVRALSEQTALVTGRFVLSGGTKPEQAGWFTLVWVHTAVGWRAVHDHTS
jgi:ketosteroid isomerase-like protein